jgi:hypothetical protein
MQLDNTTANSTSTDGPYFNLDDLDELINKLDSGWKIDSISDSRIVLVCSGEIRIYVSMLIVSPNQCDLAIKFYHGDFIFGFEIPLNTNDKDIFSYDAKENVWPFILAQGLAEIFFLILYPNGAKRVGVIENNLHYVKNHDQLDLFNHFLADAIKSIDRFDKESVFLGLLSVIANSIAYTDVNEFIQDVYDAGVYEITGIPERISEFVSLRDAANCLITSSSVSYLSRNDVRNDVGSTSSTASDVMLLPRDIRALRMCLGSGALDPQATDTLRALWSGRRIDDLQNFFSCLPESLDAEVVASGLVDFARAAAYFDTNHPLTSFYAALGVLVRTLADVRYESGVLEGLDSNLLNREYDQVTELLYGELSLSSSGGLCVPGGDVKTEEMSRYLRDAFVLYGIEGRSFQDALNYNEPIEAHTLNVANVARALLTMDLIGNSQILYILLDDNFSKNRNIFRILSIRVNSAHTFEVSLVESMLNKAFIEMCGIDSRMTESDQVPAVRILLKALSDN